MDEERSSGDHSSDSLDESDIELDDIEDIDDHDGEEGRGKVNSNAISEEKEEEATVRNNN